MSPPPGLATSDVFASVGLIPRVVRWGELPAATAPGVYAVSSSADPKETDGPTSAPVSRPAISELLNKRPELTVDGRRPDPGELTARIESMWVPGAVILYIGLAGTSVRTRVRQYYSTPLGARGPHAGGWPLKTLATLDDLYVHYAACDDPTAAERAMIDSFVGWSQAIVSNEHCDVGTPLPFANLTVPGGRRKLHGISGARAPSSGGDQPSSPHPETPRTVPTIADRPAPTSGGSRSQPVTANDITRGQVRVPAETKRLFPGVKAEVIVDLMGRRLDARWDPRNGPDKPRSGLLRFGRGRLDGLVAPGRVLWIRPTADGYVVDDQRTTAE